MFKRVSYFACTVREGCRKMHRSNFPEVVSPVCPSGVARQNHICPSDLGLWQVTKCLPSNELNPNLLFLPLNSIFSDFFHLLCNFSKCPLQTQLCLSVWYAAAAKSCQSCPTLCNPIDGSPPGSPALGFPRQEHGSALPFLSPIHESEK